MIGDKHPGALGTRLCESWPELRPTIEGLLETVLTDGKNKKVLYDLLFRTSAETLLEVARNPQHLGAEIGFFSVLHSWTQKLELHPHVHCVVPAERTFEHDRSNFIATF